MRKVVLPILIVVFLIMVVGCGTGEGTSGGENKVVFKKDDYTKIIDSNNQLGFHLLSKVEANKDGNVFISPTSLLMALSMVYNGADGDTKEEMAKVLHMKGIGVDQLNKANASLSSMLKSNTKQSRLTIANSLWINDQFHFQDNFAENVRGYYKAKIQEMDITSSKTPKIINDWVKESTNGKIDKIIGDSDIDRDTVAFLINAIYFKGNWMHEFDEANTEKRTFYLADGTTKDVPFMFLNEKLPYLENENFQAVSLPYAEGKLSMKVFLPRVGSSLKDVKALLTNDQWEQWNSQFHEKEGVVILPKFKLEYETELSDALKQLGMTTAFDERAQFTKMIKESDPLSIISKVKQKTFLEVNEKGTEAAATTSVQMKKESISLNGPFHLEINRPFLITIDDEKTGAILFMGTVSNP